MRLASHRARLIFWVCFLFAVLVAPLVHANEADETPFPTREEVAALLSEDTTYYQLLGLDSSRTFSDTELKSAARKLAMQFHPDTQNYKRKNKPYEATPAQIDELLQRIIKARDTLKDEMKRWEYDYRIGLRKDPPPRASANPVQQQAQPRPRSLDEEFMDLFGWSPSGLAQAPKISISAEKTAQFKRSLENRYNIIGHLQKLLEHGDDSLSDPNLHEALKQIAAEALNARSAESKQEKPKGIFAQGAMLLKATLDPWKELDTLEPKDLSRLLLAIGSTQETKALIELLALDRIDRFEQEKKYLTQSVILVVHAKGVVSELAKHEVFLFHLNDIALHSLLERAPSVLASSGFSTNAGDVAEAILSARRALTFGQNPLGNELSFQSDLIAAKAWASVDRSIHERAEARIREILEQKPNAWEVFSQHVQAKIQNLEVRLLREAGAGSVLDPSALERLHSVMQAQFQSTQSQMQAASARTNEASQQQSAKGLWGRLQSAVQTAKGFAANVLGQRGGSCGSVFAHTK